MPSRWRRGCGRRRSTSSSASEHFLGEGKLLRRLLAADRLGSVIFYGPPGTGKTTLAHLLGPGQPQPVRAAQRGRQRRQGAARGARRGPRPALGRRARKTLLFVDEIHRFNKAQQDVLLPDVEEGVVILVGATTQNPFFAINSALVSRSRVFQFEPLSADDIKTLVRRALADRERGLGEHDVRMHDDALEFLAEVSDGDARRALGALEVGVLSSARAADRVHPRAGRGIGPAQGGGVRRARAMPITTPISALIKSMRGSDPDAAIYWLARMLEAGEDVRFLARRIVIFASEDVGNADPQALPLAVAAMQACEFVGLPECQLNLAQAVTYLACAPKSNAAMVALCEATRRRPRGPAAAGAGHLARQPLRRRPSDSATAKAISMPTTVPTRCAAQDYLGVEREYYRPVDRGLERELAERLEAIRTKLRAGQAAKPDQEGLTICRGAKPPAPV